MKIYQIVFRADLHDPCTRRLRDAGECIFAFSKRQAAFQVYDHVTLAVKPLVIVL